MELKEIRYFLEIAETGNMSRAAERLFITQPALSHFLNKLEDSLKVKLFQRQSNNALTLTAAGKIYLEGAREIAAIQQSTLQQLSDFQSTSNQTITIGLSSERATKLLADILPAVYEQFPGIKVDVVHHTVERLKQFLKEGQLDFVYSAFNKKEPCFKYMSFDFLNIDLLVPATHRLASLGSLAPHSGMAKISLSELKNDPFILLKKNTVLRDVEESYFSENHLNPNVQMEMLSIASSISVIHEAQYHVGLFPRGYSPYHDGSIRYLNLDPPLLYEVGIYYRKESKLTKAMKFCISLMQENLLLQTEQLAQESTYIAPSNL